MNDFIYLYCIKIFKDFYSLFSCIKYNRCFNSKCIFRCCVHALVNLKLELVNAVEAAKLASKEDGAAAFKGSILEDT